MPSVITQTMVLAIVTVVLSVVALRFAIGLERRRTGRPLAALAGVVLIAAGTVATWSIIVASGDRSYRSLTLGPAATYERIAIDEPRRQVMHVATIDFDQPCIELVTTRPDPDGLVAAETGTEFVDRTGATVSINLAFFFPFEEYPYWSSYPDSGEVVTAIGPVVIDGQWLGDVDNGGDNGLALTDGLLSASVIPAAADFAVRGRSVLVADGKVVADDSSAYARSVAGVDLDTNSLVLVVSDGKQPGYAEGSTYREMAEFLIGLGVDQAVEFDGGGSATMAAVVEGNVELLSRPSHQRLPGRQRPVASHLGIKMTDDCSR